MNEQEQKRLLKAALDRLSEVDKEERSDRVSTWLNSIQDMEVYQEELRIQSEELALQTENLKAAQRRYFQHFDMAPLPILRVDRDGMIMECNLAAASFFGLDRRRLLGTERRALTLAMQGRNFTRFCEVLGSLEMGEAHRSLTLDLVVQGEVRVAHLDLLRAAEQTDERKENPALAVVYIADITSEIRRDEDYRLVKVALDQATIGVVITNTEGTIQYVNDALAGMYQYEPDELLGQNPSIWKSGLHGTEFYRSFWRQILSGQAWFGEFCNKAKDGSLVYDQSTVYPVRDPSGKVAHFIAIKENITQIREQRKQLEHFSKVMETSRFGVVITDERRKVIWVNPAFQETSGFCLEEIKGCNLKEKVQGPDTEKDVVRAMHEAFEAGRGIECELTNYRKDGVPFYIQLQVEPLKDDSGRVTHFVAIQSDVTERRQMQEQLRQKQRMESVGLLAGGLAHDINNMLQPLRIGVERLKDSDLPDEERTELLEMMQSSVDRASATIRGILTFARGSGDTHELIDLRPVATESVRLANETLPRGIDLEFAKPDSPVGAIIDPTQYSQVILNLLLNARDAIGDKGKIVVRLAVTTEGFGEDTFVMGKLPEGPRCDLQISDDGSGIETAKLEEIFQPFYTTKGQEKGTGMGLATSYGIIKAAGGAIAVRSARGQGTTFHVCLPSVNFSTETESRSGQAGAVQGPVSSGRAKHILVVDDERLIVQAMTRLLTSRGFEVTSFTHSEEAARWLGSHQGRLDAIITDYMMPSSNGLELIKVCRGLKPEAKSIIMTGLQDEQSNAVFQEAEVDGVLPKPFTIRTLLDALDCVFSARAEAASE